MRYIDLAEFSDFPSEDQWKIAVARALFVGPADLERSLQKIAVFRNIAWDMNLGTYLFLN